MIERRLPAPAAHLARRIAAIRWSEPEPGPLARRRLAEICRAELDWAREEWRTLYPAIDEREASRWGRHPSEDLRLPHEAAAAQVLNAHHHVDVEVWRLREIARALKQQRCNACDGLQSVAYRAAWKKVAEESLSDLHLHRARRRAWRAFLTLSARYRTLREALAQPHALAA